MCSHVLNASFLTLRQELAGLPREHIYIREDICYNMFSCAKRLMSTLWQELGWS
jgi:hypothetical protein